jgi:hypothetical protein
LNCSASDQNGEIVNVCKRFCFEAVGHSDRISSAVFRLIGIRFARIEDLDDAFEHVFEAGDFLFQSLSDGAVIS